MTTTNNDRSSEPKMRELTVTGEWTDSFDNVYETLSCGHSRRKEAPGKMPDRGGPNAVADANLPEDRVYCWHMCHEEVVE